MLNPCESSLGFKKVAIVVGMGKGGGGGGGGGGGVQEKLLLPR